jgi:hypothetical protein
MVKEVMRKSITETFRDDGSKKTVVKEIPVDSEKKVPKEKKMTAREREELLIENFVGLQHAMTNLSIRFGSLSDNIIKLLSVLEESAKNFMEGGKADDQDLLKKINSLLDQNKTIAKGLVLMESKLRGRAEQPELPSEELRTRPRPLPSV